MHGFRDRENISANNSKKTLEAIELYGFDSALEFAYERAIDILLKTPDSDLAVRLLEWSGSLLDDARKFTSNTEPYAKFMQLSSFYRKLAHRVYWYQRSTYKTGASAGFLQII